jgi:hypothetical protein
VAQLGTTWHNAKIDEEGVAMRATLSKGRSGWCVLYRHPIREAPGSRQKLRIRRGLGTRDNAEAQRLVDQLNEILDDKTLWNPAAREIATIRFDKQIVAAFYDYLEPNSYDPWSDREKIIPLPNADDGYAKIQLVGTTGAGKTTLVRQLLGTDPNTERFPSTSAAKTTICDIELVLADGPFKAAVSFIPKDQVRQFIADCVAAAAVSHLECASEGEMLRRFLEHSEQRFRLSYLLGNPLGLAASEDDLFDDDDESAPADTDEISDQERSRLVKKIGEYISAIKNLAESVRSEVASVLGNDLVKATLHEREKFEEIVEYELFQHGDFHAVVDDILDDVESRFDLLSDGEKKPGRDGWPVTWSFDCTDREKFIRTVNRFSSNYAPNFGKLLTPIVQGIRVSGPFKPDWTDSIPKLVLLDGQGIGHTADTTSSVSTSITRRFQVSDLIVLVDNAAQPMQAASCSVVRSLVSSGNESKLLVCFTHFDEVKGDNLAGVEARKNHVISSFDNAVHTIGKTCGREAEQALKRLIPSRLVFLSRIQLLFDPKNRLTKHDLERVVDTAQKSIQPPEPVLYKPCFDVANLIVAIEKATKEFHDRWKGILGMGSFSGIAPEHWTRVKALTRHIGLSGKDEYDNLKPAADLIRILQQHVSLYLAVPLMWQPKDAPFPPEEQRLQAVDSIRKQVYRRLHDISARRLIVERLHSWMEAYSHHGTGSTRVRAREVVSLYESAAPIPTEISASDENQFLFEVRELVKDAILSGGGEVVGWSRGDS